MNHDNNGKRMHRVIDARLPADVFLTVHDHDTLQPHEWVLTSPRILTAAEFAIVHTVLSEQMRQHTT